MLGTGVLCTIFSTQHWIMTSTMMTFSCIVCDADLTMSVKRRALHPLNANAKIHESFCQ